MAIAAPGVDEAGVVAKGGTVRFYPKSESYLALACDGEYFPPDAERHNLWLRYGRQF